MAEGEQSWSCSYGKHCSLLETEINILESDFPVSIANPKLVGFQKNGSAYSACYNNITKRRGKKRALVALAHRMLMDIYRTLKTGEPYVDEGAQAVFERTFNYRYDPLSSAVSIPPLIQRPFDRSCIWTCFLLWIRCRPFLTPQIVHLCWMLLLF